MNIHTSYIKNLSNETGKSYRELETYWKIAENIFKKLQMLDPNKYQNLKEGNAESQEIKNIFEKSILRLPDIREEKQPSEVTTEEENEFEEKIENNLDNEKIQDSENSDEFDEFDEFNIEPEPKSTKEKLDMAEKKIKK